MHANVNVNHCMQWVTFTPPYLSWHPLYRKFSYPTLFRNFVNNCPSITLKLHLQESRHNLMSAICACCILMSNNPARDLFWLFPSFSGCPYFSGFFSEIIHLQINKIHFRDFNKHFYNAFAKNKFQLNTLILNPRNSSCPNQTIFFKGQTENQLTP